MEASTNPPRRVRRSSISDHIHRVFSKSMDKRNGEFVPPVPFLAREAEAATDNNSHARHSLHDETGPSSLSYSSNSRLPSTGTPGSSLSVANGAPMEDETPTQQMTPLPNHPSADVDNICKSPTWDKPKKKEKRVTKRLEAERKELEKRLLALEDAQSKADLGVYERSSRRLTKKQPVSSSSRSSSANAERPRSSSGLSSIFRRSRRNSNSSEQDSASAEFSQLRTDTNPPSLPLTLPERFGTAITRELQSKHGTALNLSASNKTSNSTQHNRLHASAKSDDLRENWRMAEAWKTKDGRETNRSVSEQISNRTRSMIGKGARNGKTPAPSGDLDKELFSAALKHDRKSVPAADNPLDRATRHDRSVRATSMPTSMSQSMSQPNFYSSGHPDSPTQVTTARQLQELTPPEIPDNPSSPSTARPYPPPLNPALILARKSRVDPFPRAYKSSPLALNPANTDESSQDDSRIPKPPAAQNLDANPLQSSQSPAQPHPEDRGRSGLPIASSHTPKRTASRFKENFQETSQSIELPQIPAKSDRRSLEIRGMPTTSNDPLKDIPVSPFQVAVRSPFHTGSVSPAERNDRTSKDLSDDNYTVPARSPRRASCASTEIPGNNLAIGGPGGFIPGHSRSPSHASSHDGHSNYDTADEDAPESPRFKRNSLTRVDTTPSVSAAEASVVQEAPVSPPVQASTHPGIQSGIQHSTQFSTQPDIQPSTQPDIQPSIQPSTQLGTQPGSPQTRPGPMSILKRRSQKAKAAQSPQTIAKIFVICCRCKYWHDLPSEVYARLACPERLGSDSKLGGSRSKKQSDSGTRKLTGSRSLPFGQFPAPHATQGTPDLRPAPLLPRKVTCCWCGHNMSRSCCEGWTTVVEMRERHH
ncbi:hypothetical protein PENPOL_c012G02741 [Penicillium polonicum]|uniref:Uncharacterized protein n=1 Tax=Penicillium polonicum TaxID=60169 RepID=A0A1V6NCI3_PENPO|nr:hypothetical protein PENPOL_c012G02741 [Penicillium polonicum]